VKVLVLDEALPYPPDSGKRIRTWALLTRLAREVDITLCVHAEAPIPEEAAAACAAAGLRLLPVPRPPLVKKGPRFAWDLFRNLFLGVPYMAMAHRTAAMRDAALVAVTKDRPDLIHVEWTPYAANVPPARGIPVVVAAHNVESEIWRRYRHEERSLLRRAYVAIQHKKVARFERAVLATADAVTAVSDGDAERIRTWTGQSDVTVVENGVDGTAFAPRDDVPTDPATALFTGSLDWRPNQDAVTWYLEAIHPLVRARSPEARFAVVGRHPPAWLVARVRGVGGAEVHGSVPDVRPFVARATVNVVPLRIGGGSRLKIPEALAMARPVLATTVGAEGLDLGDAVVLRDEPAAFADAVLDAFTHPDAWAARARAGRERVLARHEWGRIAPKQLAVWRRVAGRGRRPDSAGAK
jgi:glycosyltransferase involved in cell wall biosynthesis